MAETVIYIIIWVVTIIAMVLLNKFVGEDKVRDVVNKTGLIIQYAQAFVAWARQFKSELSGADKMNVVIEKLTEIAFKNNIDIDEDELRAIAQKAYDDMKSKEEK